MFHCSATVIIIISLPLCLHLLTCTLIMPKNSWASEEQQTWLLAHLSTFHQAQEAKTTQGFFIELYQKFHEQWPLASPNSDKISKADGNEEKAITLKLKASKQVSGSFTVIYSVTLIQYILVTP